MGSTRIHGTAVAALIGVVAANCAGVDGGPRSPARPLVTFADPGSIEALREDCPWPADGTVEFAVEPHDATPAAGSYLAMRWTLAADSRAPVGIRVRFRAVDLSGFDHLVFRARAVGDLPVGDVHVGLRRPDSADPRLREAGSAPLPQLDRQWRTVSIPLVQLIGLSELSGIDEFVLFAAPTSGGAVTGAIAIDEVVAVRTGVPADGPWDRPAKPLKRRWVAEQGGAEAAEVALLDRARALPQRLVVDPRTLPAGSDAFLRRLAADTWRGLDGLRDRDSGLPFDTVAVAAGDAAPEVRIGDYTSVTNVGLYLMAVVAARDLGLVDAEGATVRVGSVLATLEGLETHAGFLFNYYDTTSRERGTHFVSFVDSAWLAAGLIVARNAFPEMAERATALLDRGDFSFFHDPRLGLMTHGRFVHLERTAPFHYGLFYTEARVGSLLAIARGDVPAEHWFRMLRVFPAACAWQSQLPELLSPARHEGCDVMRGTYRWGSLRYVPSWGGSMFEALMPMLVLDERRLAPASLGRNAEAHVAIQRAWGGSDRVWGRSPSRSIDGAYREFGVPALGVRGYPDDVVTPHASVLALAVDPDAATANLLRLAAIDGLYGDFGLYDAVEPDSGKLVQVYLALDQAMTLIALANHLGDGVVQRQFAADREIAAVLPLLAQERFFD